MDYEATRQVWNAKIPVEITVESEELLEPARPYYVMLPRCGYFTFIMPKVVQGFVKQGKKPVGLTTVNKETTQNWYMQTVKEADYLKRKGDMISCMKSDDHKQLWNSLATNQFDAFWTVNRKLMECSDSQPFIWLPIRLHEHGKSFKQQTIAPLTAGHPTTLEEAVRCIDSTIDLDATKIICHDGAQKVRHVLIMDEVDGMSGNEDRAGISELMDIIKSTMIPIICICNDRSHPKMRSLVNYCFDVRFPRPRVEQVRSRVMTIAVQEKMRISKEELDELIELSNHDVRQCIYNLQMRKAQPDITIAQKDVTINPFEAARKLLSKSTDLKEKQEMFFVDYGIMPLFVFENYLQLTNKERTPCEHMGSIRRAAELISMGDQVDKMIRSTGAWRLLNDESMLSAALPSMAMDGYLKTQISFPGWLGKNSTAGKRQRLARQVAQHAHLRERLAMMMPADPAGGDQELYYVKNYVLDSEGPENEADDSEFEFSDSEDQEGSDDNYRMSLDRPAGRNVDKTRRCRNCGLDECPRPRRCPYQGDLRFKVCKGCGLRNPENHTEEDCERERQQGRRARFDENDNDDDRYKGPATWIPRRYNPEELFGLQVQIGEGIQRIAGQKTKISSPRTGDEFFPKRNGPHGSFDDLPLSGGLHENIRMAGFTMPTPIEYFGLQKMLEVDDKTGGWAHKDMVMSCQTGAGKTTTYVLGIIEMLNRKDSMVPLQCAKKCQPRAIILATNHELAEQIANEAKKFAYDSGLKIHALYGGTFVNDSIERLEPDSDIVVATIGRLGQWIKNRLLGTERLEYLAVDEFHEFVDWHNEPRTTSDFNVALRMMGNFMPSSQRPYRCFLTSAAMNQRLREVGIDLLSEFIDMRLASIERKREALQRLLNRQFRINAHSPRGPDNLLTLEHMTDEGGLKQKALIFANVKKHINGLVNDIMRMGFDCRGFHSNLSEEDRAQNYKDFSDGRIPVLVATNMAANGLDFGARGVQHVINYQLPSDIFDHKFTYIERIGRTGRAGKRGLATTFFDANLDPRFRSAYTDERLFQQHVFAGWLAALLTRMRQRVPQFIRETAEGRDHRGRLIGDLPRERVAEQLARDRLVFGFDAAAGGDDQF
ncbi:unnamed protein product, partial [Mesorhabditis spiculigera]